MLSSKPCSSILIKAILYYKLGFICIVDYQIIHTLFLVLIVKVNSEVSIFYSFDVKLVDNPFYTFQKLQFKYL